MKIRTGQPHRNPCPENGHCPPKDMQQVHDWARRGVSTGFCLRTFQKDQDMPLPLLMRHCPYFPWSLHRSPWRLLPLLFPNPWTLDSQWYRQLQ